MGYTTDFTGQFDFNKKLDDETYNLLVGLSSTRRVKRKLDKKYGVDGEFYYKDDGNFGQNDKTGIIDSNTPPSTQPSLWLQWRPTEDRLHLEWDESEKFYGYVEWLEYLIEKILKPSYILNGDVKFKGEDIDDFGTIEVKDNVVKTYNGSYKTVITERKKEMNEEILNELDDEKAYEVLYKFSDVSDTIQGKSEEEVRKIAEERLQSDYSPQNDTTCYDIKIEVKNEK